MGDHIPVLLEQTLDALELAEGQTYVDCTAGLGGHAIGAARRVGSRGTVVLNDWDQTNLARAGASLEGLCRVELVHGNFAELAGTLQSRGVLADAVLADLGFASVHVDQAQRGFSFMRDGPLDMRYDAPGDGSGRPTAAQLVNSLSERELVSILREFGEEPKAKAIAQKLVQARGEKPIETTAELAALVRAVVPRTHSGSKPGSGRAIDPATKTFQAFRIAVNDEIGSLAALLASVRHEGNGWLSNGARFGIICFHSLEDRLVKRAFADWVELGLGELVSRKPITADEAEIEVNPRSRSAKLRVIRLKRTERG